MSGRRSIAWSDPLCSGILLDSYASNTSRKPRSSIGILARSWGAVGSSSPGSGHRKAVTAYT